jgi:heme oxygenase
MAKTLKEHTAPTHEALHHHPALKDLVTPAVTYPYYLEVLKKFYGFYEGHEQVIARSPWEHIFKKRTSGMSDKLRGDLEEAGLDPATLLLCEPSLSFKEEEEVWAYLYVKEGSLLGGRVIYKSLTRHLAEFPENHEYFKGLGNNTAAHWYDLSNEINGVTEKSSQGVILNAANTLFADMYEWMSL